MQLSANEPRKNKRTTQALVWDWTAAGLLLTSVLVASGRLVVTQATENLYIASFLAILGTIAGLTIGRSRFPAWLGAAFGLLYGLFFIPWQLGLAFFADKEWTARLHDLAARLSFAINQFTSGENVEDPLLFVTLMAIIFWIFGLNAGYRLAHRGDVWAALMPFGLVALIIQANDTQNFWRAWLVALFFLCALLLVARIQLLRQQHIWESSGINVPFELSGSITRLAFIFAALMVLFAWATPTLGSTLDSIETFWAKVLSPWSSTKENIGRVFFPLQGGPSRSSNVFGERFSLGRGIPQSAEVLFTVESLIGDQVPVRLYWRNRVYDQYENGLWTSGFENRETWEDIPADQFDVFQGRIDAQFVFSPQESVIQLHTASQTFALDRVAEFSYASNDDGSKDAAAFFSLSPVLPGESYSLQASVATPSSDQLRNSGVNYPGWITDRYLQLPANFSTQIIELAQNLAQGEPTPYDITLAITDYLRNEIEYVDLMPVAPFGRDPIEWALFELKQGFCNYYASAEVLMLRSLGIPARFAVGYAQGEQKIVGNRFQYIVRTRDAHAWPEVFFPSIGWVEFEPTASQSPLSRPTDNPVENLSEEELLRLLREELTGPLAPNEAVDPIIPTEATTDSTPEMSVSWLRPLLAWLAFLALGLLLLWNWQRVQEGIRIPDLLIRGLSRLDLPVPDMISKWAQYSHLSRIEKAYTEISLSLIRLGRPAKAGDTPQQRSSSLEKLLPILKTDIQTLSQDYQFQLYSRSKISREERAIDIMKRLRWATRRKQISEAIKSLFNYFRK